jgi:hypothetical protein
MRRAEPVAALGGIALIVSLFLPWYGLVGVITRGSSGTETTNWLLSATGWQAMSVVDILLALLALLAIAVPIVSLTTHGPVKSMAAAVIASATGWIAIALVVLKLIDNPGTVRYGAWIALAAATIAWVGSWNAMRDDSTPGAVPPDVPRRPAPNITP